jgi:hypothetical protein
MRKLKLLKTKSADTQGLINRRFKMKITKTQLKQIIKEEISKVLSEDGNDPLNIPGVTVYGRQRRRGKAGETVRGWAEAAAADPNQRLNADQIEQEFRSQWGANIFGKLDTEEKAKKAFERFIQNIAPA